LKTFVFQYLQRVPENEDLVTLWCGSKFHRAFLAVVNTIVQITLFSSWRLQLFQSKVIAVQSVISKCLIPTAMQQGTCNYTHLFVAARVPTRSWLSH